MKNKHVLFPHAWIVPFSCLLRQYIRLTHAFTCGICVLCEHTRISCVIRVLPKADVSGVCETCHS
jgi:hypothetical protein